MLSFFGHHLALGHVTWGNLRPKLDLDILGQELNVVMRLDYKNTMGLELLPLRYLFKNFSRKHTYATYLSSLG